VLSVLLVGLLTLLWTINGMVVNNVVINCLILKQYLIFLPSQIKGSVVKLLIPADPQDVSHAIENKSTFNPSQMKTIKALQLVPYSMP